MSREKSSTTFIFINLVNLLLVGCGSTSSDDPIGFISQAITPSSTNLVALATGSEEQGPSISKARDLCDKYYSSWQNEHKACVHMMLARIDNSVKQSYTINGVSITYFDKNSMPTTMYPLIETADHWSYSMNVEGIWDENGILCRGIMRWGAANLQPFDAKGYAMRDCQFESTTEPWTGAPFQGGKAKLVSLSFGNVAASGLLVDPVTGRFRADVTQAFVPYTTFAAQYQPKWLVFTRIPPKCNARVGTICTEWIRDPDFQEVAVWGIPRVPWTSYDDCNMLTTTKDLSKSDNKNFSPATQLNTYAVYSSRIFVTSKTQRPGTVEIFSYYDRTTRRHFMASEDDLKSHPKPTDLLKLGSEGWVYPYKLLTIVD